MLGDNSDFKYGKPLERLYIWNTERREKRLQFSNPKVNIRKQKGVESLCDPPPST